MGLFINKKEHLGLYKDEEVKPVSNQTIFRSDSFTEAAEEQRQAFKVLNEKHSELQKQLRKHRSIQTDRWITTGIQLEEIIENQAQQIHFKTNVIESIQRLDHLNEKLQNEIEAKRKLNEYLVLKIENLNRSNNEIAERLEKVDNDQAALLTRMDTQIEQQMNFSKVLEEQTIVQNEMSEQLNQHEGLLDKFSHQLNFLKSVLFERTHFIAEKIDDGHKLTTAYLNKLKDKVK